jgi:glyoxylate/hydroxypyruvate reductase A
LKVLFQTVDPAPEQALALLAKHLPDAQFSLWPQGKDKVHDVAVCWKPPADFFTGRTFKAIFNIGAGVDALLQHGGLPSDTMIVRLEDAGMAAQMEEYAAWAALTYLRNFNVYAHQQASAQWQPLQPRAREDFAVGIMGLGLLGQRVAGYLRDMGFTVRGWNRSSRSIEGVECYSGAAGLHDFLAGTRMLVCLLPLTDETRGVLNRELLSQLPPASYLVNIARGLHLNEADLLTLLDAGHLAGATLDVFAQEPLPADHAFWHHPKITLTPHISAQTLIEESMRQIAAKIAAFGRGEPVTGVVDRSKGY